MNRVFASLLKQAFRMLFLRHEYVSLIETLSMCMAWQYCGFEEVELHSFLTITLDLGYGQLNAMPVYAQENKIPVPIE